MKCDFYFVDFRWLAMLFTVFYSFYRFKFNFMREFIEVPRYSIILCGFISYESLLCNLMYFFIIQTLNLHFFVCLNI